MTADVVFGRDPVLNDAFSFVKLYIFTRFGLAFTLKRSNGGLESKQKVFRKQRFIILMRMGKKEDSQKCWLQSLWHLYRRNRRTLCMQASLRASSPGGAGMREGKGEDLIGEILTTQHQMSHREFWGWNSNAWDASASSPSPFPSPTPTPSGELARRLYAGPRMP